MEILDIKALRGPNPWARVPVLVVTVRTSETAPVENSCAACSRRRLLDWLPELSTYAESVSPLACHSRMGESTLFRRFEQHLQDGIGATHVVQYLTQILQMATGVDSAYAFLRKTDAEDVFELAFQYEVESLARACLACALAIWKAAEQGAIFDFSGALRRLVHLADDVRLGPSTRAIIQAAARRGIPWRRISEGSLVMLGEGKRQRRICTAETDATSAIAESIARDKDLTKRLLHAIGIPVPRGQLVGTGEEAWRASCEIGTPVAVKPSGANHAQGVSLNLFSREQVAAAFSFAQKHGDEDGPILVEQYIRGDSYRLLVVDGSLVAAARGQKEYVVGDGKQTIRELLDEANRDPRRGDNYTDPLTRLDLDVPTLLELEKQGLTPHSIPAVNQCVLLSLVGDYTMDCTEEVHPETAAQAVLAARLIGLDVAGIDVVAEDISQPLAAQRGAILEVNAGPALGMHVAPLHGRPQPVGEAIVARLFPTKNSGRIPVFVVTGEGERTANAQFLERCLIATNRVVGRAGREGLFVAGKHLAPSHPTDRENAEGILLHPEVELAVIEADGPETAERGLGCSRADIAIVTCRTDQIIAGASNPRAKPLSAIAAVHAVPPDGLALLPFTDWARARLAPACRGKVFYYSLADHSAGVHSENGLFWIRGNDLVLSQGTAADTLPINMMIPGVKIDPRLLLPSLCGLWLSGLTHLPPPLASICMVTGNASYPQVGDATAIPVSEVARLS